MVSIAQEAAEEEEHNIMFHTATFQSVDYLADSYDWILCQNILEYTENPKEFLMNISQKQNENGMLSLFTHNPIAKVMKKAIVNKDPQGAQASIGNTQEYSGIIQTEITIYSLEQLIEWLADCGYEVRNTYGIHNIYG